MLWGICLLWKFQLHHTGIKTGDVHMEEQRFNEFQLHHTGIKTGVMYQHANGKGIFQLHHTGIKTRNL